MIRIQNKTNLILIVISLSLLIFLVYKEYYYTSCIDDLEYEIENLKDDIKVKDELIASLESKISNNENYTINKVEILEKELQLIKNIRITDEVFYNMIEETEFEDYIVDKSENVYNRRLEKVKVDIVGIKKVINFYQHLSNQYYWLYLENNIKK